MENAADALKMAAAILIFIIAIASSFSLFGTAKQTADSIINMKDKQAYLAAAELDNGILYTSTSAITDTVGDAHEESNVKGVTINGDRIVGIDDVVSTILRYNKEKYGVTIIEKNTGKVLVRFDSNTENVMRRWNNIITNDETRKTAEQQKEEYTNKIKENLNNYYSNGNIQLEYGDLELLYKLKVEGNSSITCGAPWYGNDKEIQKRIACDLDGTKYLCYDDTQEYQGKGLINKLTGKTIIEVTNEIDQSEYFKDTTTGGDDVETPLLAGGGYQMPTVEIVYIIY